MERLTLKKNVPVFGVQVKTFPQGIGDAFEKLVKTIPGGFTRSYYGLSIFENGSMKYYATAEETFDGEAEKYGLDKHHISRGEYLVVTVKDWRSKTDSIKNVFHEIMTNERADNTSPAVEWYKNDEEMICMVRMKK